MNWQHCDIAEPPVEQSQHFGQSVGAPDQRERTGGVQNPRRRSDPAGKSALARNMRGAAQRIG
jgi:hypothetical protein